MINVLDIAIAVLVLAYLIQNLGWPLRILRSIFVVLVSLIVFGIIAGLLSTVQLPEPAQKTIKESYFVNFSYTLIKLIYPALEKNAPKMDAFIKDKIISSPTTKVTLPAIPTITLPEKLFPDI